MPAQSRKSALETFHHHGPVTIPAGASFAQPKVVASALSLLFTALLIIGCTGTSWPERPKNAASETSSTAAFDFNTAFDELMQRYRLPGLAVAVVKDGKVFFKRTAGETVAGSGEPITPDTLFRIASLSKAMTTGVMARLVDAGKLHWDDRVTDHLPAFRMKDPWVTREMQVRDLLLHNSGLPPGAGDLMLWPEPNLFTRADILAGLAHLQPSHSFRADYAYDNLLYVVAGEVAAAAAGSSYEELVRHELFAPLAMTRCQAGEFRRDEVGNIAQPHMQQDEHNVPIRVDAETIPLSPSAAAGGIRCSLNDMITWMQVWLDPGLKPSGRTVPWLSPAQRDAVWTPHTTLPLSRRQRAENQTHFYAYGYGWRLADVHGYLSVWHSGTLAGMYSSLVLLPEKQAGFVILINGDGSEARGVLHHVLLTQLTAPSQTPSVTAYADQLARSQLRSALEQNTQELAARYPATPESMAPQLGIYRDLWFGEISLCEQNGQVHFSAAKSPRLSGSVMRSSDRLLVDWHDESIDSEPWLEFSLPDTGGSITLQLGKIDPYADISYDYEDLFFTRVRKCP